MIETSDSRQIHVQIEQPQPDRAAPAITFYPTSACLRRNRLQAVLLLTLTFSGAILLACAAYRLWPTYNHTFTPYLKWQDALLATLCWAALILLLAALILVRFLYACYRASRHGILIFQPDLSLIVRDLSPKNFHAVYSMVASSFTCLLATLAGLSPLILLGSTLTLSNIFFAIVTTAITIALSLAGLFLCLIFGTFLIIGLFGARALTRALGASYTYHLTPLTTLRLDHDTLTITSPNQPETLFDLHLLHPHDQRHLLHLLQQHIRHGSSTYRPSPLDQQLEAALQNSLNRGMATARVATTIHENGQKA